MLAVGLDALGKAHGMRAHPGRILDTGLSRHVSAAEIAAVPVKDELGRPYTDPDRFVKTV